MSHRSPVLRGRVCWYSSCPLRLSIYPNLAKRLYARGRLTCCEGMLLKEMLIQFVCGQKHKSSIPWKVRNLATKHCTFPVVCIEKIATFFWPLSCERQADPLLRFCTHQSTRRSDLEWLMKPCRCFFTETKGKREHLQQHQNGILSRKSSLMSQMHEHSFAQTSLNAFEIT